MNELTREELIQMVTELQAQVDHLKQSRRVGENNHLSKLTEEQVIEIRRKLDSGQSMNSIAKEYGVVRLTIRQIKLRLTWKHI